MRKHVSGNIQTIKTNLDAKYVCHDLSRSYAINEETEKKRMQSMSLLLSVLRDCPHFPRELLRHNTCKAG